MGAIRQSPLSSGAKLCPSSILCRHPEEESSYMIPGIIVHDSRNHRA